MTARLSHRPGDYIAGKDQYKVLEKIKSGGMGTVYKVEKVLTGNLYAVKECDILDDPRQHSLPREEAVRIFVREGRLLESLKHPGIPLGFLLADNDADLLLCLQCGNPVPAKMATCGLCNHAPSSIYYRPQHIAARYYLFMEYIEGTDAGETVGLPSQPLAGEDLRLCLSWMGQLASILAFLHGRDLVHRDVKPENLRIATQDGRLYLLDYGLLVLDGVDADNPDAQGNLTENLGSEGFAPPEQAEGAATAASDIHAMAMTFLNLATGLDPANPLDRRKLTATAPAQLVPELDARLARLVADSLAANPGHRPDADQWRVAVEDLFSANNQASPASATAAPVMARPATPAGSVPRPVPAGPSMTPPRAGYQSQAPAKQTRVPLKWLLAALAVAAALGWFFNPGIGQRHQVVGKPGAVIYANPAKGAVLRTLAGGELLEVTEADQGRAEGNWLRVLAVDKTTLQGYVNRAQVRIK